MKFPAASQVLQIVAEVQSEHPTKSQAKQELLVASRENPVLQIAQLPALVQTSQLERQATQVLLEPKNPVSQLHSVAAKERTEFGAH